MSLLDAELAFIELHVADVERAAADLLAPLGLTAQVAAPGQRLLSHRAIALLLTGGEAARPYVERHGDGVQDIAFAVPDAARAFAEAVQRGAEPLRAPEPCSLGGRRLRRATVAGVGDMVHSFVEGWHSQPGDGGLRAVDHIAICLPRGALEPTVAYYERVFGFHVAHEEYVATEAAGMSSKVVQSANGRIRFPLQEPMAGKPRGQIVDYLERHDGPGVQHVAFLSDDIVDTVRALGAAGMEFLAAPGAYYDTLQVGAIEERLADLRHSNVLVDRDDWGYLLQIFSRSRHARRTLFFEVIQRRNARGFGSANVRALFRALEQQV